MRSPNTTVLSYGKNPKARKHAKPQYYAERHIVDYRPISPTLQDTPDYSSKTVPALPNLTVMQSNLHNKSSQMSLVEKSRRSDSRSVKTGSHIEFERLYYVELEKNKNMEVQLHQLREINERLTIDKKSLKEHYEEFIRQLQGEVQSSRSIESKYNTVDTRRRVVEEELHKLKVELELIKQTHGHGDDDVVDELRDRIRTLNDEKMELLNTLKSNKTEVNNLRAQINYFQGKEKELANSRKSYSDPFRNSNRGRGQDSPDLRESSSESDRAHAALKSKDAEISTLKSEIAELKAEIARLKGQLDSKDGQISILNARIKTLELPRPPSVTEIIHEVPHTEPPVVTRYPRVERISVSRAPPPSEIYRDPIRIETSSIARYPSVERISIRREPIRVERSPSPPPTLVRTYTNPPVVTTEYIDRRTGCCCCDKCDFCLNRTSHRSSVIVAPVEELRTRHSVHRYSRPESLNISYRGHEPLDRHHNHSPREARSVTRINLDNSISTPRRIENRTSPVIQRPISNASRERYTSTNQNVTRIVRTPDKLSPRQNSKSLELYKYYDQQNSSLGASKYENSPSKVTYGNGRVSVNGTRADRDSGVNLHDSMNNSFAKPDRNAIQNERRLTYGNETNKFSEYNYM